MKHIRSHGHSPNWNVINILFQKPMVDAVIQLGRLIATSVVFLSHRHLEYLTSPVYKTHRLAAAQLDSIIRESVAL